ncbi:MAG: pyruvate kinase [Patescibacteria group bacterium]
MKKTKIVATIGPKTENQESLEKLLKAGMNVMRLNFSHGDFAEHQKRINNLKKAVKSTGINCAVLQDLGGPKIRLGEFNTEQVELVAGEKITITTESMIGDSKKVSINYKRFPKEVKVGDRIMVDDGKKKFEVVSIKGEEVICKIIVGGMTKGKRGVNLPDSDVTISSLTAKDKADLEFGIKNKVDFMALSFVRTAKDIVELRTILDGRKSKTIGIIAKIETPQAVQNIDEILAVTDGVMIARGDLAIEVPFEKVPTIQKSIIEKCNNLGKPVITATQMLESMIKSPVATRAEVSDIANAIFDGTDAVMLSEETTLGLYSSEAVEVMTKVAREVEKNYVERDTVHGDRSGQREVTDSVTSSVVKTAHDVGAKMIIALTDSGFTARMISRHKPHTHILALSPNKTTVNKLCLSFGCKPVEVKKYNTITEVFQIVRKICLDNKYASKGDKVVIVGGVPFNTKGLSTNMLVVEEI